MDWVLKLASVILLFELVKGFPRREKDANKYESNTSHGNLKLELHHEKDVPQHQNNILVPYENSLKQIAKEPASSTSHKFHNLWSERTVQTPENRVPSLQNSKDSVEKYAMLALIPVRGRRTWRRRGFKIYNAVPDARYHFDSMAIDPMFNFLGIGK
ncbi:uncharacterized protein LOC133203756 [Saccostrea echinata]|uniref:uncharacterized protein LOC133203756 n=1 Tax=Saccostrea echinata TaxID=191078 RepID=UPI002A814443|nr:uncharacterized protein LOC133203756 [Saccostrea echinata]